MSIDKQDYYDVAQRLADAMNEAQEYEAEFVSTDPYDVLGHVNIGPFYVEQEYDRQTNTFGLWKVYEY